MAKSLNKMSPIEVCGYLRDKVRYLFGDKIENATNIYAESGYYCVTLPQRKVGRRTIASESWTLRRWQIKSWISEMAERGEREEE